MSLQQIEAISGGQKQTECRGCEFDVDDILPGIVVETALKRYHAGEEWFWCAPRLFLTASPPAIVGSGAYKNPPVTGSVEIGYGIARKFGNRGYATSAVEGMLREAFARKEIIRVTAETTVANIASERVLAKNGFYRTGNREDPEDGLLTLWQIHRDCYDNYQS